MPSDFSSIINNDAVVIVLTIIVILYASYLRVEMPNYIKTLFENNIFRIIFLSLLLILAFNQAPHVAITMAIIFVLTLYFLNEHEAKESFRNLERFKNIHKEHEHIATVSNN